MRRLAFSIGLVVALTAALAAPASAAKPDHFYDPAPPLLLPAGEVCDFAVELSNTVDRTKGSVFAPAPDGTERLMFRGFVDGRATNLETGAWAPSRGGARITLSFAADGTVRVDASGTAFIAWYYPGDNSNLAPGLYEVNGHATEWYASDGSLVRAIVRGRTTDLCAALS